MGKRNTAALLSQSKKVGDVANNMEEQENKLKLSEERAVKAEEEVKKARRGDKAGIELTEEFLSQLPDIDMFTSKNPAVDRQILYTSKELQEKVQRAAPLLGITATDLTNNILTFFFECYQKDLKKLYAKSNVF